ncbi:MAG: hypothetical protein VR64_17065 [Desulfatitalea sp. BRH_c12]|nr:MAG: hypothetical protein VR64_17065 [Desulfatitalea sp. BRH_c12]
MVQSKKQFRRVLTWSLALLLGICFTGVADIALAAEKPIVWRLQSVWATSTGRHPALQKMCAMIKEKSNGQLDIKLFGPGEIVGTMEVFDAVSNGVLDMAASSGIYNSAKVPEGLVEFGLPFGLEDEADLNKFWYEYKDGEAFKLIQEAYRAKKIELLYNGAGTSYGYMTTFPVKSLDDFKGKKIRSFGFFGSLVQMLGGAPVSLPNEDQYLALQQGTVDGTIFPYLALNTMKFKEVAKHIVLPPVLGAPTADIFVSAKAWSQLNPELQAIVREGAVLQNKWYMDNEGPQEKELVANPDKHGIQVHTLSAEDVAKLKEMGTRIWDGVAKRSPTNAKVVELLKAYNAEKVAAK